MHTHTCTYTKDIYIYTYVQTYVYRYIHIHTQIHIYTNKHIGPIKKHHGHYFRTITMSNGKHKDQNPIYNNVAGTTQVE